MIEQHKPLYFTALFLAIIFIFSCGGEDKDSSFQILGSKLFSAGSGSEPGGNSSTSKTYRLDSEPGGNSAVLYVEYDGSVTMLDSNEYLCETIDVSTQIEITGLLSVKEGEIQLYGYNLCARDQLVYSVDITSEGYFQITIPAGVGQSIVLYYY